MRITAYSSAAFSTAFPVRASVYQKADQSPSGKDLIVRREPAVPTPAASPSTRPFAPFLAQLMAKTADMPVSRLRRRADPAEAAKAYRAGAALARARAGKRLGVV